MKLAPVAAVIVAMLIGIEVVKVQVKGLSDQLADDRKNFQLQISSNLDDIRGLIVTTTNLLAIQQRDGGDARKLENRVDSNEKAFGDLRVAIERLSMEVKALNEAVQRKQ